MQSISFISASSRSDSSHWFPARRNVSSVRSGVLLPPPSARFRLWQTAVCSGILTAETDSSMRPAHHSQPSASRRCSATPGVFPAGRHRAPRSPHSHPRVAEQVSAQFIWREGISPHEGNLVFPATATSLSVTRRRMVVLPVYLPIPTDRRLQTPAPERGVVLQRQRLTVLGGDAVFSSASRITGARSASFSIR